MPNASSATNQPPGAGLAQREAFPRRALALMLFRLAAGTLAAAVAVLGWTVFDWDSSLNVAIAIMSGFIVCQTIGSYLWARPYIGMPAPSSAHVVGNVHADAAKLAITTRG